jgi:hypothetical protein
MTMTKDLGVRARDLESWINFACLAEVFASLNEMVR